MFAKNRFVVVDDNETHLHAIRKALEEVGSSCVTVHYDITEDLPPQPFERVRVIFMDLQLNSYMASSDSNAHYSTIQTILEDVIPESAAPFLMVLWTSQPEKAVDLETYLAANITDRPSARPVKVVPLDKTQHINIGSGAANDPQSLRDAIINSVRAVPSLAVLLEWETDIIAASDRVIRDVADLAAGIATVPNLPAALALLMNAAVGHENVRDDPKSAFHAALLPLLVDSIQHSSVDDPQLTTVWRETVQHLPSRLADLTRGQAAALNSQIHLGGAGPRVDGHTWGAVCEADLSQFDWLYIFGMKTVVEFQEQIVRSIKVPKSGRLVSSSARPVQIRIGASCDYAQQKPGPVPFVMGAFVPVFDDKNQPRGDFGPLQLQSNSTMWISPMLDLGPWGVGHFVVDPRFIMSRSPSAARRASPVDRIREQLLLHLISAVSGHSARPGIVQFQGTDPRPRP